METLYLTSELRSKLKAPLGTLIGGEPNKAAERLMGIINCEKPKKIFAVGDTVTSTMVKHGVDASVYIVDNRIMRKRIKPVSVRGANEIHIKNPSGTITSEAWKAVEEAAKASSTTKIVVDGEEDLLALPAAIFAPEGSFVLYGQPLEGIVLVRVTQEKKEEIRELIKAMSPHKVEGRIKRMKIKKKSEKYNPVLRRKEVTFVVNHPSSGTPLLFEIRKALASTNKVGLDSVYISKMYTLTGTNQTVVRAEIYDSPEAVKLIVPKHIQMRNMPPGEKGEEAKATKKKVSKPAKKG